MSEWLQLGAVGVLGVAMLALINAVLRLAGAVGHLEASVQMLVQIWAAREGVRVPNPAPGPQRQPASVIDLVVKGGAVD